MGDKRVFVAREDEIVPSPLVVFSEKHTKSFANEDAIPHALDASAIFGIAGVMSVATATGAACFSKALKDENEIAASFYIFFFTCWHLW